MTNPLWIVIPIFNRTQYISSLIQSLETQSEQNWRVLLVDHGSRAIEVHHPKVETIRRSSDLWFTGALNEGLRFLQNRLTSQDYFLTMNDDVRISDVHFIRTMKAAALSQPRAIVTAMGLDLEGRIQYAGIKFKRWMFRIEATEVGKVVNEQEKRSVECDALPTRSTIFRADVLSSVGLLDEVALPQYGSDYEYTMRAKKLGYRLILTRSTFIATESNSDLSRSCSGRKIYNSAPFTSFLKDLRNPYLNQSFEAQRRFAFRVFPPLYARLYLAINLLKMAFGFFLTNYIRKLF